MAGRRPSKSSTRDSSKAVSPRTPRTWIRGIKFRALGWLVAIVLATVATVVFAGVPAWPAIGFAFAVAYVSVGKLTTRLLKPTCLECGHDLSGQPIGMQGIVCPECGSVNSPGLVQLARMGDPQGKHEDDKEPLA
ncbi:MAG TPA: hypothetical protein VHC70_07270 [Phycisphaerales bacterium]|nr:hypothetical protein [Phycisphaerales bacterium]